MPVQQSPDMYGNRWTGCVRVRSGWFGIAIIEELVERSDGRREWVKAQWPVVIMGKDCK